MSVADETTCVMAHARNEQLAKIIKGQCQKAYPDSNLRYEFITQGCWRIVLILDGERIAEVNEMAAYCKGFADAIAFAKHNHI